jgi:hypothetical protein
MAIDKIEDTIALDFAMSEKAHLLAGVQDCIRYWAYP